MLTQVLKHSMRKTAVSRLRSRNPNNISKTKCPFKGVGVGWGWGLMWIFHLQKPNSSISGVS